ncbi:MAG: hypothetical protein K2G70_03770 [Turicibacter sp.]|nr:hypothetical protein [Turicibacter sp.]
MNSLIILFFVLIISMLLSITWMVCSILRQGDERYQFMLMKAIKKTFIISIGILFLYLCEGLYASSVEGVNPFIFLFIVSVVFSMQLLMIKKKYGN